MVVDELKASGVSSTDMDSWLEGLGSALLDSDPDDDWRGDADW